MSVVIGHNPATGQGLGFNIWNALSLMLHAAAVTILIGIIRHAHILAGPARNRH
jgi:heme exporter protein D